MPSVGQLKERVLIQTVIETRDTVGQPVKSWATLIACWARIDPIAGRERYVAAQEVGMVTNRITVRHNTKTAAITPEHRVVWKKRIYNILSIRNMRERDYWVQMVCVEVVS